MRLPIVKQDGTEFENAEELSKLIQDAGDDLYLLTTQTWHGGIHISEDSAPWAKDTYPVRCIADGEVVAYRMMEDYLTSEFKGETLNYSNSFCLVRHHYEQEDDKGQKQGFTYYSLYMHLCPWKQWPSTERYRLNQRRNVRNSVPQNGQQVPAATLPVGETFEPVAGEAIQQGQINGVAYDFMRIRMLSEGVSNSQVLATKGTDTLWIAKDETVMEQISVSRPNWIYDQVEATVKEKMNGRADPKPNKVQTGFKLAGDPAHSISAGTKIRFDAHRVQFQEIGGKARKMARCELPESGRSQWVCVEEQYIDIISETPTQLDKLYELPNPVPIRAGDTIGYLGLYESPASLDGGKTGNAMIHLEVFSPEDDVEDVVKSKKWQDEGFRLVDGSDCDGVLDPEKVPDFFRSLCSSSDSAQPEELDAQTVRDTLTRPSNADERHRVVAKHNSEWWAPKSEAMINRFRVLYTSPKSHALIDHEVERATQLSWMDKMTTLELRSPLVWHIYPSSKNLYEINKKHPTRKFKGKIVDLKFLDIYSGETITEADYKDAANDLNCEPEALQAIAQAETKSTGSFYTTTEGSKIPSILYERHFFSELTSGRFDQSFPLVSNPTPGGYGLFSDQYDKLLTAYDLAPSEALKSASWGKFQIMGRYHSSAGYPTVEDFVKAMSKSEKNHLKALVNYIKSKPSVHKALKNKNWLEFALGYNGPNQDDYDKEMKENYEKLKQI
ncbi:N-acetylmuramidase family protein [Marinobacter mangrovi]|uniref:N-acetylmuramidase family protein n=1 Tax=Marinobacter mangrovi TaxID=2803918 RepID=UPI001933B1A9|nr:N-acetylmuramidase family protein [Marinobacter mangrovi]